MLDHVLRIAITRTPIALAVLLVGVDCGDNAQKARAGGPPRDAGRRSDAGGSRADKEGGLSSPATTIGKGCVSDADCGNGMCATSLGQGGAMSTPAPGGYCTVSCATQADCSEGTACVGVRFSFRGHCSLGCKSASDCRDGYRCAPLAGIADGGIAMDAVTATCQPMPETDKLADGAVGSACAADANCGSGRCMLSESITKTPFPDGYCTGRCVADAECGAHGLCAPGFLGAIGSCYRRCESDTDCGRDGYRCRVSSSSGVGACLPGPKPLPDHVVGNACSGDADCGGGKMTCTTALTKVGAGYCSQSCAVDADCGAGGVCISGVNGLSLSIGTCYRACVPPGDCRDGYTCRSFSGASGDERGVCSPDPPSDAGTP